ncbi:DEKNAAC101305 [Brettanomyces naardenensis]|uniref:DEKNAAC101305 n=1 Tax=Brettanomyces naardenensis TaxID=13370 RepID=A0A448YI63_BRENA|nr:DEKNAAC101305 [Brettanomyces naardenensis]
MSEAIPETDSPSSITVPRAPPSESSFVTKREVAYPARICEIIENSSSLQINIVDAARSSESHGQLQPFIVYSISLGPLIVKRRYSEFESLRICLTKCFPTLIIPPIPEKQSIKSNITETTSTSLGITHPTSHPTNAVESSPSPLPGASETSNGTSVPITNGNSATPTKTALMAASNSSTTSRLIEYRKRMLAVFLNRCLANETLRISKFFLNFLDPETNFLDYLSMNENSVLYRTSIYRLSPFDPLGNLSDQLYLTLPIPSSAEASQFPELSGEQQFQKFISFENKFQKYEAVLDKISKCNKRLLKHFEEMAPDLTDLGSQYNTLSLLQDSNFIEDIGKIYERKLISIGSLADLISLNFLDRLVELKHFTKTVKELTEYNRKKVIQCKVVEKQLAITRQKYKSCESQEAEIKKIDQRTNQSMGNQVGNRIGNGRAAVNPVDAPITDEELQTALYAKSKKPFYGRIPGITKINSVIQKYTDNNPEQTRLNKVYNLKLKLYQLERQHEILASDIGRINREVLKQLVEFHEWFKAELSEVVSEYNGSLKEYIGTSKEAMEEII